jgi:hypothetical protein
VKAACALDYFKAGGWGSVLLVLNPKNLLLIVAGMAAIAQVGYLRDSRRSRVSGLHARRDYFRSIAGFST